MGGRGLVVTRFFRYLYIMRTENGLCVGGVRHAVATTMSEIAFVSGYLERLMVAADRLKNAHDTYLPPLVLMRFVYRNRSKMYTHVFRSHHARSWHVLTSDVYLRD